MRTANNLTLIQMAVKKDVAVRPGVIYDSPGDQEERGRLAAVGGRVGGQR
jgi:hypothetical protein